MHAEASFLSLQFLTGLRCSRFRYLRSHDVCSTKIPPVSLPLLEAIESPTRETLSFLQSVTRSRLRLGRHLLLSLLTASLRFFLA